MIRYGFVAALVLAAPAMAQLADRPVLSLTAENDLWGSTPTDRYYTNGLHAAVRHGSQSRPFWHGALAWLPLLPREGQDSHETGLMQLMFTPSTTSQPVPRFGDRPYAGILAGTFSLARTTPDGRQRDQLSLLLGVIGPASLAADTQIEWHRIINSPRPMGWATQLGTEPAVNLAWRRSWRMGVPMASVTPHVGAAIGNVYDYAAGGLTVQLGAGQDVRSAALEPFGGGIATLPKENKLVLGINLGVEGRAVARNLFLDGNSFTNGRGVQKKTLVGDAFVGASVRWQGVRVSVRHVWRSREFAGQPDIQRFGAITVDMRL
ncbi:MAG: lipid A deacylase LpxR family protein [Sphingomonadales bacterium]|jgi:hypothetical protein